MKKKLPIPALEAIRSTVSHIRHACVCSKVIEQNEIPRKFFQLVSLEYLKNVVIEKDGNGKQKQGK